MNRYGKLFAAYVDEMRKSKSLADSWCATLLVAETKRLGNAVLAQEQIDERWPFGSAAHPFVLATYRKYFLECEALNDELEAADEGGHVDADDDDDWGEEDDDEDDDEIGIDFEGPEQPISPHSLLIDLLPGRNPDLEEFLSGMVFAPIGLDDADRSV